MQLWRNRWVFSDWATSHLRVFSFSWPLMVSFNVPGSPGLYAQKFSSSLSTKKYKAYLILYSLRSKWLCSPCYPPRYCFLLIPGPPAVSMALTSTVTMLHLSPQLLTHSAFLSVLLRGWWLTQSQPVAHRCVLSVPRHPSPPDLQWPWSFLCSPSHALMINMGWARRLRA